MNQLRALAKQRYCNPPSHPPPHQLSAHCIRTAGQRNASSGAARTIKRGGVHFELGFAGLQGIPPKPYPRHTDTHKATHTQDQAYDTRQVTNDRDAAKTGSSSKKDKSKKEDSSEHASRTLGPWFRWRQQACNIIAVFPAHRCGCHGGGRRSDADRLHIPRHLCVQTHPPTQCVSPRD